MSNGDINSTIVYSDGKNVYTKDVFDNKSMTKKEEIQGYNLEGKPSNLKSAPNAEYEFNNNFGKGTPKNDGGIAQVAQTIVRNTVPNKENWQNMKQCTRDEDYYLQNYGLQQQTLDDLNILKNQVENTLLIRD